jgi:uncharacterized protein YbjT (DUF2867 family)
MPVLVTGAEHAPGRACGGVLRRRGGAGRAYLDPLAAEEGLVPRLRTSGCKVARGTLEDEGTLELALAHTHTVVHAAADLLADPGRILDDVATVLAAALGAGVRRFVLLSHLGVGDPRGNAWLAALAAAEELLAEAPIETVAIRRALTYGLDDPVTAALAESTAGALPDAMHTPLWSDDLAAGVAAADARDRDVGRVPHLVVPLGGPQLTSLGEFVALLGGQVVEPVNAVRRLPDHVVDVLSRDLLPPKGQPAAGTGPERGAGVIRDAGP